MTPPTLSPHSLFDVIADAPGLFLRIKRTMIEISHAIEAEAGTTSQACQLFVGFQRFSLAGRSYARYAQLCRGWQHCWVFGVPDAPLPPLPNVTPVPLPDDHPLISEWFVVADGPTFGSALLTADVSGFAIGDRQRQFMGMWTADARTVRAASDRARHMLELPPATWDIDPIASLAAYDRLANHLVAQYEEIVATLQSREKQAQAARSVV